MNSFGKGLERYRYRAKVQVTVCAYVPQNRSRYFGVSRCVLVIPVQFTVLRLLGDLSTVSVRTTEADMRLTVVVVYPGYLNCGHAVCSRTSVRLSEPPRIRLGTCPIDNTNRSWLGHTGSPGSKRRNCCHKQYATGAIAMGVPGCPELAACTASIDSARMVLILVTSIL
jgi:hypothetical protein